MCGNASIPLLYHVSGDKRILGAIDVLPQYGQIVAVLHHAVDVDVVAHLNADRLARRFREVG